MSSENARTLAPSIRQAFLDAVQFADHALTFGPGSHENIKARLQHLAGLQPMIVAETWTDLHEKDQALVLRAGYLISDLFDRCGQYEDARSVLLDPDAVERRLRDFRELPPSRVRFRLLEALLRFRLLFSVSEHRLGHFDSALRISRDLKARITKLTDEAQNARATLAVKSALHDVALRISYAAARHAQSQGTENVAEESFGEALERSSLLLDLIFQLRKGRPCQYRCLQKIESQHSAHNRFWKGMILIGLARTFLNQGQLTRSLRLLFVARDLLLELGDVIEVAFVDFLIGSIYRQQGRRTMRKGIQRLESALAVFEAVGHERYLRRVRIELTKAYLNGGHTAAAEKILKREPPSGVAFAGDPKTRLRWYAEEQILWAQIWIATGPHKFEQAKEAATLAQERLGEDKNEDLRARAHAVLGELCLAEKRYGEAVTQARQGLALKFTDLTERAWLLLVLGEAYLNRRHVDNAEQTFQQWNLIEPQVENEFMRERAAKLGRALDLELASFYLSYTDVEDFKYDEVHLKLREFLVRRVRALHRGRSQEEHATALGISRQTYSNWLSELRKSGKLDD